MAKNMQTRIRFPKEKLAEVPQQPRPAPLQHFAHECRIALEDAGMIQDRMTADPDGWEQDVEDIIKEHIQLALDDRNRKTKEE